MKIFITGITGFVGASTANYFASAGHQVQGIGRKPTLPSYVSSLCGYKPVDIRNPIEDIDADIVIHSAALASDTISFEKAYDVNVRGTEHVLHAARNARHFIHISSSSVYDFADGKMKRETDSVFSFNGLSAYGQTKWLAEELINYSQGSFKKSILRPRAIYGKYDQLLIPRLLKLVKANRMIIPSNLTKQISLTHISNLIMAISLCIRKQQTDSEVFNIADGQVYDLNAVLPALLHVILATKPKTMTIPSKIFELMIAFNKRVRVSSALNPFAASSLTNISVLNIDKISKQLGYKPENNFFNSCGEIAKWIHKEEGWKNFFKEAPVMNF